MVKAPENFLDNYLRHEKRAGIKTEEKPAGRKTHSFSEEEHTRLNQNLQLLWSIYQTREIKEILPRKHKIRILGCEGAGIYFSLSYEENGIIVDYEIDMGCKKELAGARLYQQGEIHLNRYITHAKGMENLLQTKNSALLAVMDTLIQRDLSEMEIWDAIAKGESIYLLAAS
ncbi:MAG: hypothetical protein ACUBOA_09470 [Candidatus Loosdrechtia sp.]|uniref:hypothetical protein n=1 Tax=Candidatus Loosdrechtia sp. TaxID=3101272 RepID=UPI003A72164F|nr:MAG: hypothetical protein QY305_12805 [Candidatus Jettenia sp. AMX2]